MSDDVTFLGYDREGDKVWRSPDGLFFPSSNQEEAADLVDLIKVGLGWAPEDYIKYWGPITKEKP